MPRKRKYKRRKKRGKNPYKKYTLAQRRDWVKRQKKKHIKELTKNWPDCCKRCELMQRPIEEYANACLNKKNKFPLVPTPNFPKCQKCKKFKRTMKRWSEEETKDYYDR